MKTMPLETLEFEEPIAVLLKEIEALALLPRTDARNREVESLRRRIETARGDLYRSLTPWQRVLVARHPSRPGLEDFIGRLFTNFVEIHGDRRFADDHAMMTGFADYKGQPVLLVGQVKGHDTKEKIFRNFGYARPEGYRKALRAMRLAEKFGRPIIVFVDTPAAYPGIESEERGVAEAIAVNLREMMMLDTPVIVIVSGEGGSGGALGIAVGDRVLMQEFAIYSVIPPEGCAALVWRDSSKKAEAAAALRLTAPDLLRFGITDETIPEPIGGAHTDPEAAAQLVDGVLSRVLAEVKRHDVRGAPGGALQQVPEHGTSGHRFRGRGRMSISPRWDLQTCDEAAASALTTALGLEPAVARLLCQRGLSDPELAERFLNPSLDHLHDPMLLADMGVGVDRILAAIAGRERIAIHGDYDVDGVTSTVILRRALEMLGADVTHFIPERLKDGYGLQPVAIERLHAEGVTLVVSVDCGIRGADAARRASWASTSSSPITTSRMPSCRRRSR